MNWIHHVNPVTLKEFKQGFLQLGIGEKVMRFGKERFFLEHEKNNLRLQTNSSPKEGYPWTRHHISSYVFIVNWETPWTFANTCCSAWSFKHFLYALHLEKCTLLKPWKNLLSCIHIQFKSVEYPSRHTVHSSSRSYSNLQVHFRNPKFVLGGWTWQRVNVKIREGTKYMTLPLFPF